jgi:hypothetical protein
VFRGPMILGTSLSRSTLHASHTHKPVGPQPPHPRPEPTRIRQREVPAPDRAATTCQLV